MFAFINEFINNIVFALIVPGILTGIVCVVAGSFLPTFLSKYKLLLQLLGLGLILFFVFQGGRSSENSKWKQKELEYQVEIAALQVKSANINTKIIIKYVDRIKIVEKIKEVPTIVYVDPAADAACVINKDTDKKIKNLLDNAATGKLPVTK